MKYNHEAIWNEMLPSLTWSRNWHNKEDNKTLCEYASKIDGASIIELGSAEGQSTISMLLSTENSFVEIIDPFITTNLLTNLKSLGLNNRVVIIPAKSEDAKIANIGEVGLLFIDAVHSYEAVRGDLEKYSKTEPKYILLHDTFLDEVYRAVKEFLEKGTYKEEFVGENITVLSKL